MSNVLFGKLGQNIIYNRMLPEAMRSNANGNYEAYNMLRLLLKTDHNIFCAYDNIKMSFEQQKELCNLYLITDFPPKIDVAFIILGYDTNYASDTLLEIINSGIKWYALCTDPRCLHKLSHLIKNPPIKVYAGAENETVMFAQKMFKTSYLNIEAANIYDEELCEIDIGIKHDKMVIVANHTEDWDRIGRIKSLIANIPEDKVVSYGRLGGGYKEDNIFKGERSIQFVYNAQLISRASLIAPIYPGWITAKYLECITRGVVPIMTNDYGTKVECFTKDMVRVCADLFVTNPENVHNLYKAILNDKDYLNIVYDLYNKIYNKYGPDSLLKNLEMLIGGNPL